MVITYYGAEAFKVQFGETILGFNPVSKADAQGSELKPMRFGADIAFVTLPDSAFNGVENLSYKEKKPFVIFGPGEYEIKEVFIKGYPVKSFFRENEKTSENGRINTIYSAKLEGMHIAFLGAIGSLPIDTDVREDLGEVDILFVPIGGEGVLSARDAYKLSMNIGAKLIIPMHYEGVKVEKDALQTFLKEAGIEKAEKKDKLTIKPKDIAGMENEVMVLKTSN